MTTPDSTTTAARRRYQDKFSAAKEQVREVLCGAARAEGLARMEALNWAKNGGVHHAALRGLVTYPLNATPPGSFMEGTELTSVHHKRSQAKQQALRDIAERILKCFRGGLVKNVSEAQKVLRVPYTTCYRAWNMWGPDDPTVPDAQLRSEPLPYKR